MARYDDETARESLMRHVPLHSLLELRIVSVERGYAVVEMPVRGNAVNGSGNLHGGALATLLDVATGMATGARPASTASSTRWSLPTFTFVTSGGPRRRPCGARVASSGSAASSSLSTAGSWTRRPTSSPPPTPRSWSSSCAARWTWLTTSTPADWISDKSARTAPARSSYLHRSNTKQEEITTCASSSPGPSQQLRPSGYVLSLTGGTASAAAKAEAEAGGHQHHGDRQSDQASELVPGASASARLRRFGLNGEAVAPAT